MKLKQFFLILILCCFSQTVLAGKYSVMGVDDDEVVDSFFLDIQQDLRTDNAKSLSEKVKYPFKVNFFRTKILLNNNQDFIDNYNKIFSPDLKQAILCETIEGFHYGSSGVWAARGSIYLNLRYMGDIKDIPVGRDKSKDDQTLWQLKITTINNAPLTKTIAKDCLKKRAEQAQAKANNAASKEGKQ